ncbi:AAA family ATPase [Pontibacter sp. E15-1]|uniref:shikimate kinase n=1 Tax=Pontibacter sp. E15-1 TaxID=2919918 RepID=UPI001F4FA1AE|nr:shikimate kinase [Pontibacter sp. E15-1]MCJ8167196.1 AAA family ATPase [Pontibacter sp. E15-1]
MIIFLVGMMGSGKTTLGRQLAAQLQHPFVDLDTFLEQREGRTIAQLFAQEGQERFRALERQALEAVVREHAQAVVSTGGGAPCFFDNMEYMSRHGKTFFLDVPVAEICKRLSASDLQVRPLLAGKTEEEVMLFLVETLNHRRQFYQRADATVQGAGITSAQLEQLLNNNQA